MHAKTSPRPCPVALLPTLVQSNKIKTSTACTSGVDVPNTTRMKRRNRKNSDASGVQLAPHTYRPLPRGRLVSLSHNVYEGMGKHTTKQFSWIGRGVEKERMRDGGEEKRRKWKSGEGRRQRGGKYEAERLRHKRISSGRWQRPGVNVGIIHDTDPADTCTT